MIGGLLATIVMTMFMMMLGDDSPPPTAALWAKYVGDEGPEAYMMPGMALHMMYGIGAGGAFALIATTAGLGVDTLTGALLWALGYAAVLTVVGMVFWMRVVLAMEPKPQMAAMFGLFHAVYGVALGTDTAHAVDERTTVEALVDTAAVYTRLPVLLAETLHSERPDQV